MKKKDPWFTIIVLFAFLVTAIIGELLWFCTHYLTVYLLNYSNEIGVIAASILTLVYSIMIICSYISVKSF